MIGSSKQPMNNKNTFILTLYFHELYPKKNVKRIRIFEIEIETYRYIPNWLATTQCGDHNSHEGWGGGVTCQWTLCSNVEKQTQCFLSNSQDMVTTNGCTCMPTVSPQLLEPLPYLQNPYITERERVVILIWFD